VGARRGERTAKLYLHTGLLEISALKKSLAESGGRFSYLEEEGKENAIVDFAHGAFQNREVGGGAAS